MQSTDQHTSQVTVNRMNNVHQIAIRQHWTLEFTPIVHFHRPTTFRIVEHRAGGLLPTEPLMRTPGRRITARIMEARTISDLPFVGRRTVHEFLVGQVLQSEHKRQHEVAVTDHHHGFCVRLAVQGCEQIMHAVFGHIGDRFAAGGRQYSGSVFLNIQLRA